MFKDYIRKTPTSGDIWKRALKVFAGGVNHNLRQFDMVACGAYPPYMKSGEGGHVWDVDGNDYVDWWMTHYSHILGHNHPRIRGAIKSQLEYGIHLGAVNKAQVEFAEKIQAAIPTLRRMRFCTTGSEATMYATRLARLFTGKSLVAKTRGGWHGGNDALAFHLHHPYADEPFFDGVSFDFNDQESFDNIIKKHGKELAAVVIEPVLGAGGGLPPEQDFLPYLREQTESHGILLIFDEIITGFRLRYGAAGKDIFRAEPDLLTLGKIAAGGMPLGVYGGREDVMALASPGAKGGRWVGGGTFSSHPLSMAAGIATLEELRTLSSEYEALNKRGDRFRDRVNSFFMDTDSRLLATGTGSITFISCLSKNLDDSRLTSGMLGEAFDHDRQDIFQGLLMKHGIFGYHGLGALSFAHTNDNLEKTFNAITTSIVEGDLA